MADDELYIDDMTPEAVLSTIVMEVDFTTGMLIMPPEFMAYTKEQGFEASETKDVMTLKLKTMDGVEHEFQLWPDSASQIALHTMSWISELHQSGRCGCDEHTK